MQIGIASIQRDRARWLSEWIAFHYLVGFRKFYIYLHKCSDNSEEVLKNLARKIDIETVVVDPNLKNPQLACYKQAYAKASQDVDWLAFIDGDEFLLPTSSSTIQEPLEKFSNLDISALGVYWKCFGSSGFEKEPRGLIIQNYQYRAANGYENNRHIKSIVKTGQENILPVNPHFFQTPLGTVDENLRPITKGWTDYEPTYNSFCINHYVTQSREFFDNFKSKVDPPDGAIRRDESFWKEHDKNDILDRSMQKYIYQLKNLLKKI